ncbi:unnamed protein product [Somion occarium]|uniref:Uncharacterized protein n=1 Tax=Somion occarium TaxID=3059160 RepID=A0ABP1EAN9_9APHY
MQNAAIITNDAQFFGVAIDDTLTPTYYSLPFQPPLPISAIAPDFFFSSDIPPETNELPLSPESSLVPEQHVATAFQGESAPEVPVADDEDAEGEVDDEYPILFRATPSMLGYIPIAHRRTEPPLWKSACQARVDHIKALYGIEAIRATVDREAREANAQLTAGSPSSPSSEASASPCSSPTTPSAELTVHDITVIHLEEASLPETEALKVEICTPSDFSSVEPKIEMESKVTDSELVLADEDSIMDTTFDWDEDSDEDDDFDFDLESEVDIDDAMTSPHESLVSFPDIPYTSNQTRTYTPNLALSLLQLPRLSDIPVYPFYGGYQEMEPHGTPARRPDHAAGSLLHA